MPYAVELFLDDPAEAAVRAIWQRLTDAQLMPVARVQDKLIPMVGPQPHVSLGVCQDLDVQGFRPPLAAFAARCSALEFQLASVGTFPTTEGVVFLAPVVTTELLSLHAEFHRVFSEHAVMPSLRYTPGRWIPHVTVTINLAGARVLAAINVCRESDLPISGRYERIGLVRFPPPEELYAFQIGSDAASTT